MKLVKDTKKFEPYQIEIEGEEEHKQLKESVKQAIFSFKESSTLRGQASGTYKSQQQIVLERLLNTLDQV